MHVHSVPSRTVVTTKQSHVISVFLRREWFSVCKFKVADTAQ